MSQTDGEPANSSGEIATRTLAEIYAQQGLHERALTIYRRIERRLPDDADVARRIAELSRAVQAEDQPSASAPAAEVEQSDAAQSKAAVVPPKEDDEEFLAWLNNR